MDALLQDFQCMADLIPDGIDRQSQFVGYLFIFQPVTFAHDEDLATFVRQAVDRCP